MRDIAIKMRNLKLDRTQKIKEIYSLNIELY